MPLATYSSGYAVSRFSFSLLLSIEFDIYLIDEGMPATADVEFNRKAGNILQRTAEEIDSCHRLALCHRRWRSSAARPLC